MKRILLLASIIALSACARSGPYALVDGTRSDNADPYSYDVVIVGVDGQTYFGGLQTRPLEPGVRLLKIATTVADRRGNTSYHVIPMKLEPCMRYFLAAQHARSLDNDDDWDVVIRRSERISGCTLEDPESAELDGTS